MLNDLFHSECTTDWENLGNGVRRKVAVYSHDLMLVKVKFEKNAVGTLHEHPHTQISYVQSGIFDYTIGKETRTIHAGDSCIIPPNTLHGCICLESGELIDSFTPHRADFL